MNKIEFKLENIKCEGCVKSIKTKLKEHLNISNVEIEKGNGLITIIGDQLDKKNILSELTALGYPEVKKGLFSKIFK